MENGKVKKNVVIIDGYGFVFRAFFSLKDLKTPEGLPIGAVYGFINMILKLYSTFEIDYIILVFDSGKKSFRSTIYPEYKATRSATPDDLIPQFAIIREAAEALNLKYMEAVGYEADDIIATYTKLCFEDYNTIVVSSDKDLLQLAFDGNVQIFDPMKSKFLKEADVKEKFGVKASQIVDYLAIVGDASDNIPGVAGIGEKGAVELLSVFENLEIIYENLEKVSKPKLKNALEKSKENAFLSKKLATLKFDVEVDSVQDFEKKPFDKTILFEFLKKYSLNSIIAKLLPNYHHNQGDLFASEVIPEKNETKLNTEEEFQTIVAKFISQKEEEVVVDFIKNSNSISFETKTEKFIFSL